MLHLDRLTTVEICGSRGREHVEVLICENVTSADTQDRRTVFAPPRQRHVGVTSAFLLRSSLSLSSTNSFLLSPSHGYPWRRRLLRCRLRWRRFRRSAQGEDSHKEDRGPLQPRRHLQQASKGPLRQVCTTPGSEITVIAPSPVGRPFAFGHPSVDVVLCHFLPGQLQRKPDLEELQRRAEDLEKLQRLPVAKIDNDASESGGGSVPEGPQSEEMVELPRPFNAEEVEDISEAWMTMLRISAASLVLGTTSLLWIASLRWMTSLAVETLNTWKSSAGNR